jgi:hypothetical protein
MEKNFNNQKFLEVSEPFFKKVLTRRRQKLMLDLGRRGVDNLLFFI